MLASGYSSYPHVGCWRSCSGLHSALSIVSNVVTHGDELFAIAPVDCLHGAVNEGRHACPRRVVIGSLGFAVCVHVSA